MDLKTFFLNYLGGKEKRVIFGSSKVDHSMSALNADKDFRPLTGAGVHPKPVRGRCFYGFLLHRAAWQRVAPSTQEQKSRLISLIKMLADKTAINNLLNRFQGLTCKPVNEPKLYYTDTSFDAIMVRVSQFSLGGRGLTYFFLTYCLPFPILCNP